MNKLWIIGDNDYFNDTYKHNGELKKFEGFCTDIWFDNAKKYMAENQKNNKPFFCYLSTNAAHTPYFVEKKYSDPYENNENIPNAAFYGLISNVDENIGKLVEYLKEIDLMDNTILIFSTDNGTSAGAKIEKGGDRLDGFIGKGYNAGMRGVLKRVCMKVDTAYLYSFTGKMVELLPEKILTNLRHITISHQLWWIYVV
ncbi:N-acetylgalactosamine-4-sulfatase [Algibacter lectus]|uniref:N-acetylgalactosamine-4-sulfatase n=1 Tax=Algibacter lectus TaxID=221126 RepID=A0A090X5G4_9FLAO|nr:sulfatase-like hydrolase/transferase [Algibacter lectus]GAL79487.1 N-acetylgalactosamine-4-sulfatase [Algibacter lectus]